MDEGIIRAMIMAAMENAQNLHQIETDMLAAPIIEQSKHILQMLSYLALAVEEESPETIERIEKNWHKLYQTQYTTLPPSGMVC